MHKFDESILIQNIVSLTQDIVRSIKWQFSDYHSTVDTSLFDLYIRTVDEMFLGTMSHATTTLIASPVVSPSIPPLYDAAFAGEVGRKNDLCFVQTFTEGWNNVFGTTTLQVHKFTLNRSKKKNDFQNLKPRKSIIQVKTV